LTVFLNKISNKKNYFENDDFLKFYTVNIEKGYYIQIYVEKKMIRFKLMMLELEKLDLEMI